MVRSLKTAVDSQFYDRALQDIYERVPFQYPSYFFLPNSFAKIPMRISTIPAKTAKTFEKLKKPIAYPLANPS